MEKQRYLKNKFPLSELTSKQKLKPEPVQIEKPVPPQYVPPKLPYDVFKNDWDLSDDDQTPENLGHSCFNKRSFKLTTKAQINHKNAEKEIEKLDDFEANMTHSGEIISIEQIDEKQLEELGLLGSETKGNQPEYKKKQCKPGLMMLS